MLLEEQQIEHYRILRSLGNGKVYLAKDTHLDRQVAIRIMNAEMLSEAHNESLQEARRLVLAQVEKIVKLDHHSIIPVYHYGVETIDDVTLTFIVTPFCSEGSLIDWLHMQPGAGLLAPQVCTSLIAQVAEALQYAHSQQVIHQHLTPSKLLLRRKPEDQKPPDLWVTGFEAKHIDQTAPGDPLYMAPEQWMGDAGPATDQYALAVIAYRLLTGELPFRGSLEQVKDRHLHLQPQPPRERMTDLPPLLDGVLLKALAKQPEKRFVSIAAFASAFAEAAQSKNSLCSTLVISKAEAQRSVSRTIALPGGRRTSLAIPAGAYDGQIIHLRGQGASANENDASEDLFVVISLAETLPDAPVSVGGYLDASTLPSGATKQAEQDSPLRGDISNEPTIREFVSSRPVTFPETPIPPIVPVQERITAPLPAAELFIDEPTFKNIPSSGNEKAGISSADNTVLPVPGYPPTTPSLAKTTQNTLATWLAPHIQNVAHTPLVMRARGLPGIKNILILVLVCLIIVGSGSLFYTRSVDQQVTTALQASATTQIQAVSTAFASTAVVQASATATASYDPYPPVHGSLVFADPLSNNGKGHHWQEVGSECAFMNESYQISRADQGLNTCTADDTLRNFAYQVQMTIMEGDAGGVVFRYDGTHSTFYYFSISAKGTYSLSYSQNGYSIPILGSASSAAINTGAGQSNLLAVVARGRTIDLYVNNQHLAGITDAAVGSGQIGMAAENTGHFTNVTFRDAKVWNN